MRGTIFRHKTNHTFTTVNNNLSDTEIYESEKKLLAMGYEPMATPEEFFKTAMTPWQMIERLKEYESKGYELRTVIESLEAELTMEKYKK